MTVSPRWYFREFLPGDIVSDPEFAKALFSGDGDAPLARSLIREGIQNSLDARGDGQDGVRVRLRLLDGVSAVPASEAAPFTGDLWNHLEAEAHGLEKPPKKTQSIPCLVFEDFGTTGLRGDPEHWRPSGIQKNPFFLFFRALGRSGKSDEARGRWGVGKFVFPMSSLAHVIWGFTVPSDTRIPLLMGRTVLRTHTVGATPFHPDGHWGIQKDQSSQLVSAVREADIIDRFRNLFGLERRDQPGLSIVVPWIDSEVTLQGLQASILDEYFMPLLRGELIVTVAAAHGQEVINAESVRTHARGASSEATRRRLELAIAIADGTSQRFTWPSVFTYDAPEWKANGINAEFRDELRGILETGAPVTVVLPVTVRQKAVSPPMSGTLNIHLMAVEGLGSIRPLLIRDGVSVSEEKTKLVHDFIALLTADGCALAAMIGDAETPAHERLHHDLLKNRYVYPRKMLIFVREAAASLLRSVWAQEDGDDPLALASFFPVVEGTGRKQKPSPAKPGSEPEPEPKLEIARTARRFNVQQIEGGFRVAGCHGVETIPEQISVTVAYDVRRGNPFKKFRSFDFDLGRTGLKVNTAGCEVSASAPNRLAIRPIEMGFECTVTGFDVQRDLVVRVDAFGGQE